jgi:hypothetical protein
MDKKQYQQLQKSVNRTKKSMLLQVVYSVFFWGLVGIVLSYFLPLAYYRATGDDREEYQSIPSAFNAGYQEDSLKDDTLEKYRYYWYEMGQRNLHYDPIDRQAQLGFLGKAEVYPVISRLGNQKRVAYTVEERYLFNQVMNTTVSSDTLTAFAPSTTIYEPGNSVLTYDSFLDYLRSLGEYKQAEISITLKNAQIPSELREKLADLFVQHYSIDYRSGNIFGYSDEMVRQTISNDYDQQVTESVTQGLVFLEKHYKDFGNLGWDRQDNLHFTNDLTDQICLYDFGDILDYVKDNGVKVSAVHVSGSCTELAQWLTENRSLVMRVQLQQLSDIMIQDVVTEGE